MADLFADRGTRLEAPTRFTDGQNAFLDSDLKLTVLWGGNAVGKSVVLAEGARRALRGQLPWQQKGRKYTVMLVGNTWQQLSSTLEYLFAGLEPGELGDGIRYEGGTIKGQRMQVYTVAFGPCKGSVLRCGIFRAKNLAGPRADAVFSDEPLPEDVHNELFPRLMGRNGRMYVTFTPTLGTAGDIGYLWKLVDNPKRPEFGEIQVETTVANCTPRGGLIEVPFLRQDEIDLLEEGLSPLQADMRLGRSRYPRLDCTYFEGSWDPSLCRVDWTPQQGDRLMVGIDHGSKAQAQVATLVYARGRGLGTHYHIKDMYMSTGRSETVDDARGILAMLERQGEAVRRAGTPSLDLSSVDLWIGDRSHGGYRGGLGAKSNGDLQRAIAAELGFDVARMQPHQWRLKLPRPLQKIVQPKKHHRSMWDGMDVLRRMMPQRLTISRDARMDPMADAFDRWAGALLDPLRDRLDAARYPIVEVDSGRIRWVA
mgnify:CR=1 FL=1|jgi:hypothetical protein